MADDFDDLRTLFQSIWLDAESYQSMIERKDNRERIYSLWVGKQWLSSKDFAHFIPDPNMRLPPGF